MSVAAFFDTTLSPRLPSVGGSQLFPLRRPVRMYRFMGIFLNAIVLPSLRHHQDRFSIQRPEPASLARSGPVFLPSRCSDRHDDTRARVARFAYDKQHSSAAKQWEFSFESGVGNLVCGFSLRRPLARRALANFLELRRVRSSRLKSRIALPIAPRHRLVFLGPKMTRMISK